MFSFLRQILSLPSQRELDEAWLAESANAYELERRLRALESRGRGDWTASPQGQWFERSV